MNITQDVQRDRGKSSTIASSLDRMWVRLSHILDEDVLDDDKLVEITALLNNVSYVFLYLEANDDEETYKALTERRDRFYSNVELDRKILSKLRKFQSTDGELERSRLAYIRQLESRISSEREPFENLARSNLMEVKSIISKMEEDQASLLAQLMPSSPSGEAPELAFYRIISRVKAAQTRTKLALAWNKISSPHLNSVASQIDLLVAARKNDAHMRGYESPLDATLTKSNINNSEIESFLAKALTDAMHMHGMLETSMAEKLGDNCRSVDHFAYFLQAYHKHPSVLFDLDTCLEYIFDVAKAVFGLEFTILPRDTAEGLIVAQVDRGGDQLGTIYFDLWNHRGRDRGGNHTIGIKNRADWKNIIQRPEAYVACRFSASSNQLHGITFQNVHSLFHEFGHAINHLLIRENIPNQSGLEYLPLERLELLSMWFEKWVHHPTFVDRFESVGVDRSSVVACQVAKKLEYQRTHVERAVLALLDYHIHKNDGMSLERQYNNIDERYEITGITKFEDFPRYFTWPMFLANPGANFVYLWGNSLSCRYFMPYEYLNMTEIENNGEYRRGFDQCFDFHAPSVRADSSDISKFYSNRTDTDARMNKLRLVD